MNQPMIFPRWFYVPKVLLDSYNKCNYCGKVFSSSCIYCNSTYFTKKKIKEKK